MILSHEDLKKLSQLFDDELAVRKVIRHGDATIVLFNDGTKSVVKRKAGDAEDQYYAVCAAIAKRVVGSGTKLAEIVHHVEVCKPKERGKKKRREPSRQELHFNDYLEEMFSKLFDISGT